MWTWKTAWRCEWACKLDVETVSGQSGPWKFPSTCPQLFCFCLCMSSNVWAHHFYLIVHVIKVTEREQNPKKGSCEFLYVTLRALHKNTIQLIENPINHHRKICSYNGPKSLSFNPLKHTLNPFLYFVPLFCKLFFIALFATLSRPISRCFPFLFPYLTLKCNAIIFLI